jgi:hypothetical protein
VNLSDVEPWAEAEAEAFGRWWRSLPTERHQYTPVTVAGFAKWLNAGAPSTDTATAEAEHRQRSAADNVKASLVRIHKPKAGGT